MAEITYLNFDLAVSRRDGAGYRAAVTSPGGNPTVEFDLPFVGDELEQLRQALEGPARDSRRADAPSRTAASEYRGRVQTFGERLYNAVFTGSVLASLATSLQTAGQQGAGLRIRLQLDDAPELADLPWEYLYNRSRQAFLALADQTPVVRYLRLDAPPLALQVKPPLNILVMISDPRGYARLAVDRETATIDEAFRELKQADLVSVDRVPDGSVASLQHCLQNKRYHVFHFIGHGDFDPATSEAVLLMESPAGEGDPVSKDLLKVALDHFDLRLVVLNSCEGARAGGADPFNGLAQGLVQQGVPAAIAMQFRVTDKASITFAGSFYRALANNLPVDAAVAAARRAVYLERNPTEWGTPVLFMHAPDGRIFQIDRPSEEQLRQRQIEALTRDAHAAIDNRDYGTAIEKLQAIQRLLPGGGG